MKKSSLIFVLGMVSVIGFFVLASDDFKRDGQDRVLRHVVFLDLNEQATDSVMQKMEEDLHGLKEKIYQIKELEFGANIQNGADYSHCMLLTFENGRSLKEYEEHPSHLEFASTYGKYVQKKTEVDYWY